MGERWPRANMPHGQISARQHATPFGLRLSACVHFSTLQPAAVASQHFSLSYRVRLNGSAFGLRVDTLRSTNTSCPRKRESTAPGASAPDYSGPILILEVVCVLFKPSPSATSSRPRAYTISLKSCGRLEILMASS